VLLLRRSSVLGAAAAKVGHVVDVADAIHTIHVPVVRVPVCSMGCALGLVQRGADDGARARGCAAASAYARRGRHAVRRAERLYPRRSRLLLLHSAYLAHPPRADSPPLAALPPPRPRRGHARRAHPAPRGSCPPHHLQSGADQQRPRHGPVVSRRKQGQRRDESTRAVGRGTKVATEATARAHALVTAGARCAGRRLLDKCSMHSGRIT
jgi:hypothetical protein